MKELFVDRFEGKYVICEDKEQKFYAIETGELPAGVNEGSVLRITEAGELEIDPEETRRRRELMAKKQHRSFGD